MHCNRVHWDGRLLYLRHRQWLLGHRDLCQWCSDSSLYYDAASASCKECGNVALYAGLQVIALLAVVAVLALLRLAFVRMPRVLVRISSRLAQLMVAAQQFGLKAK